MNLLLQTVLTTFKIQSDSQFSAVFSTADDSFIYRCFSPLAFTTSPPQISAASLDFPAELLHEFLFLSCSSKVGLFRSHLWPCSLLTLHMPYGCSSVHLASINSKPVSLAQTLLNFRPSHFPTEGFLETQDFKTEKISGKVK